ncbi:MULTISPECIES: PIN domain-containing protein [unclassified Nodularia (in: cyanobacteria)]|uniref:type II toxin-antitoxin system VapC family toxin n=1 Tax=unclassified Nodularia (in: cyanobacteria) TaxID=2656917 RepID=UPI0018807854|nr:MULTISPECIES: PIN domain-containing protein [unclassified Nodularia (in: cyanobacteria)]MBE9197544.1 PIN domain-containing protein [Nodularia sp. LEGE 06071]MCC2693923.1 PIN domain-containing protein [Nodularia sp. LEGE 04288]
MVIGEGNPVFLDTNILVYASQIQSPFHITAISAMQSLYDVGVDLWISRQILREYLATLTRTQQFTNPLPITTVIEDVVYFQTRFRVAEDSSLVTDRLLNLIKEIPSGGKQIHDANIVATMLVYNIPQLLTHNTSDFARFANLITVLPLQT